jgi:LysM repeat protein
MAVLCLTHFPGSANNDINQAAIQSYIEVYKDVAIDEMARTGIPASIKLAQAVLESNAGRSHLAIYGNNHFGIKCGKYWDGPAVMREDDDFENGKLVKSCFRSYPSPEFSFIAHSEFLMDPKKDYRYGFLFELPETDYKAWAKGLKRAGYATNPKYPDQLISIVERFELYQFDLPSIAVVHREIIKQDVGKFNDRIATTPESTKIDGSERDKLPTESKKPEVDQFFSGVSTAYITHINNGVKHISTMPGTKLSTIALETGVSVEDLLSFNDHGYPVDQILPANTMIYMEAKKNKYSGSRKTYRANKGESVFDIAQKFGVSTSKLMKRNKWLKGYQPRGGDTVYLKGRKK